MRRVMELLLKRAIKYALIIVENSLSVFAQKGRDSQNHNVNNFGETFGHCIQKGRFETRVPPLRIVSDFCRCGREAWERCRRVVFTKAFRLRFIALLTEFPFIRLYSYFSKYNYPSLRPFLIICLKKRQH